MKLILRVLRYLVPSKGKIVLVVFVSILTSLFSVVSIYSVLPLLNAIFTADKTVSAPASAGSSDASAGLSVKAKPPALSKDSLVDTAALQQKATEVFQQLFHSDTKQETLLKICIFLIAAFALKNLFLYPKLIDLQ